MKAVREKNLILAVFCFLVLCAAAPGACGAEVKEAVPLNAAASLANNLTALKGRTVTVTLAGGHSLTGVVKDVSAGLLHLEKLSQKEFYDGLVVLDTISCVETRVR